MRRALILIFLLVAAAACRSREASAPAYPRAPVFVISIDTLRSDRLPVYGYRGVETPHLDAFRRDAILFERAYSQSPMTLPSHLSLLTGLLPYEHGVRDNLGFQFDPKVHSSLPAVLRENGYVTGAAVSSYVLRRETGMGAIFDFYEDSIPPRPDGAFDTYERQGGDTAALALRWIDQQKAKPIFFLLHLYEPHAPYEPPEPFRSRYASSPYDGEIASADAIVGTFLEELRRLGLYDRSTIVITSDHGEGLGEHGEEQHGILLYREQIQVPLLIKLPGRERAGEAVSTPVQLADLAPTLAAVTGVKMEPTSSATNILVPAEGDDRALYAESLYPKLHFGWSELRSLVRGRHHYIESPKPELFDLASDPAELRNLLTEERRLAASFRERLEDHPRGNEQPGTVDPETAERLAALGYIGRPRIFGADGPLKNPADEIGFVETVRQAFAAAREGSREEGERALRDVLAVNPSMPEVRMRLAELLAKHEEVDEAIAEYGKAIESAGTALPDLFLNVAALHLRKGDPDQAERNVRMALDALPARSHEMLGRIAFERGDLAGAAREAAAAFEKGGLPSALLLQAEIAVRRSDYPAAFALIDQTTRRMDELELAALPRLELVRGDAFARTGRMDDAARHLRLELDAFPSNLEAWRKLAIIHYLRGERAAGDRVLGEMEEANPTPVAREMGRKTRDQMRGR
ncbi:MAG TPA: sulfatase-like hydrolase/transferase [Thermoanaerobaculia bacterium]|nr:sulfatase-like hydrolase/transferase [Thermoanaerobaculia bacterium]